MSDARLPEALPIEPVLPAIGRALRETGRAVLQAPPGAGKTTRVPLYLLETGFGGGRLLMLEPRRVAARAAAERLAEALGERVGGRVGYRIRGETVRGSHIEVITEGVLTRMMQNDPEMPGVACIIFDEFHERALQADLGVALALEIRGTIRPDLMLLAMSATLDAEPVAALMGDAPVVTSEGRAHPVETRWLDRPWTAGTRGPRFEAAVAELTREVLVATEGGIVVFLPGQREIGQVAALLARGLPAGVHLQPLHGGLPFAKQRAALAPVADGRKLVLATAIAETSLTIPDVRVVVDGGRARRARFDPGSGMSRLVTERVTRAEADQRRGRAGRVAPGWCYRCWTRGEEGALSPFAPPEIAAADLAGFALELALWGTAAEQMAFLTPPPAPALAEAQGLLAALGALDGCGRITAHGRALAALPLHPRLGHMLIVGAARGSGALAADLAALLQARDPLRRDAGLPPSDLTLRLRALRGGLPQVAADPAALRALSVEARRLRRLAGGREGDGLAAGALLSLAYPDRIARRRPGAAPRYLLSGGRGARLREADSLAEVPLLVAADLDGDPREAMIRLALPVAEADVRDLHAERLREVAVCGWSRRDRAVVARQRVMLGALVLEDRPWTNAPAERIAEGLLAGVRAVGLEALGWTPASRRLIGRVEWLRTQNAADLPDFSPEGLLSGLEVWLAPFLAGCRSMDDLARIDLLAALNARLGQEGRHRLDRLAPPSIEAPTGTRLAVDYSGGAPQVSVRLQEMFGLATHPRVGPAAIPLVIELLSPAQRPVQTTADLPGFWRNTYADVRRDLRGRYPRHFWPEDPANAQPTRRARPRGGAAG